MHCLALVQLKKTHSDTTEQDPRSLTRILAHKVMFWPTTKERSFKLFVFFFALSSNLSGLSNSGRGHQ